MYAPAPVRDAIASISKGELSPAETGAALTKSATSVALAKIFCNMCASLDQALRSRTPRRPDDQVMPRKFRLKFVSEPHRTVQKRICRAGLGDKRSGTKNAVVALKVEMGIDLPARLNPGTLTDEASRASRRFAQEVSRDAVEAVGGARSPIPEPVGRHGHVAENRTDGRVDVIEVNGARSRRGEDSKIVAGRKIRIEGSHRSALRIVSRRGVEL